MKKNKLNKTVFNCFMFIFCNTFVFASPFQSFVCEPKYTTLQFNKNKKKDAMLNNHISSVSVKAKNAETKIALPGGIEYNLSFDSTVGGWCFKYSSPYIEKEAVIEIQKVNNITISLRSKIDGSKNFCSPGNKNFYLMNKDQQAVGVVHVRTTETLPSLMITPLKKPVSGYMSDINFSRFKKSVDINKDTTSRMLGKFEINKTNKLEHSYSIKNLNKDKGGSVFLSQKVSNTNHSDAVKNDFNTKKNDVLVKLHSNLSSSVTGCPARIVSLNNKTPRTNRSYHDRKSASINKPQN